MSVQAMQKTLGLLEGLPGDLLTRSEVQRAMSELRCALTAALAQEAGQQPVAVVEGDMWHNRLDWLTPLRDMEVGTKLYRSPPTLASAIERTIEAAAKVADRFTCGSCGMDGKPGAAIRALSPAQVLAATQTTDKD